MSYQKDGGKKADSLGDVEHSSSLRVIVGGGGTGGHLFPGIAVAEEFIARNSGTEVLFVSTGNVLERSVLSERGYNLKAITSEGIKGRGYLNKLLSILKIPRGILESIQIHLHFKPDIVIGTGSYSSGPVLAAAKLLGKRIVICEQNLLPGITNRILSFPADRIYVSFEETRQKIGSGKTVLTGNPVQKDIIGFSEKKSREKNHRFFTILIIGGSQGARSINNAVIDSLDHLKEKEKYYFVHQTGMADEKRVKEAYARHGCKFTVKAFFKDMPKRYQNCDLVFCRAGATTLAELTAMGKCAVLIPYPFASDNHQVLNAQFIEDAGAGKIVMEKDLNGTLLSEKIEYYAANPEVVKLIAANAKKLGRPCAAKQIVDDCYLLIRPGLSD